jgi:hypothetical protein
MKRIPFFLSLSACVASLAGCAGHPAHTANLEPNDLAAVSNKVLCDAAYPEEGYLPTPEIEMEVARRGLNCRNYTFTRRP